MMVKILTIYLNTFTEIQIILKSLANYYLGRLQV